MKTIITAIVALTINFSASAGSFDTTDSQFKTVPSSQPTALSMDQRKAEIVRMKEENISMLNYMQTMQNTLSAIEREKHVQAIENLEAEFSFNHMMSNMLTKVEEDKLSGKMDDVEALDRYENMMRAVLFSTAK